MEEDTTQSDSISVRGKTQSDIKLVRCQNKVKYHTCKRTKHSQKSYLEEDTTKSDMIHIRGHITVRYDTCKRTHYSQI